MGSSIEIGMKQRLKVEARINQLEGGNRYRVSGTGKEASKFDKYESKGEALQYKTAADNTMAAPQKRKLIEGISDDVQERSEKKEDSTEEPKKKKKKKKEKDNEEQQEEKVEVNGETEKTKKKKKKDKDTDGDNQASEEPQDGPPKKKKKKT